MTIWDFANERPWLCLAFAVLLTVCVKAVCRVLRRAATRPPIRVQKLHIVISGSQRPSDVAALLIEQLKVPPDAA